MSLRLRRLGGPEVVSILTQFGFAVHSQRGSHVKLRRETTREDWQTLTVPFHNELDLGTLRAIFRQASRYIPQDQLLPHFYTE
ncbi:MAG: type II toxin-antitoxin system HicA family toxin [Chloroflexi bacterium]|nr:type II toxin-antitoxin system HicA family toxin [Chloroflexota bacterium]